MRFSPARWAAATLAVLMLAACDKAAPPAPPPVPAEVSDEATGYYCGMLLADHEGPKGQIYLASRTDPIWFSSVRDTIAFLRLPEEAKDIAAVYVNDMGKARDWKHPETGTWVEARSAWFVLDSDMRGGMGAPEAVPFAERPAAEMFQTTHGGTLAQLDDIPEAYVLGPVDLNPTTPNSEADAPVATHRPADGNETTVAPDHPEHSDH